MWRSYLVVVFICTALSAALVAGCAGPSPAATPTKPAAPVPTPAAPGATPPAAAPAASPTTAPSTGAQAAPAEILLGAALPITGKESRAGGFIKEGYELAIEQLNADGGVMVKEFGKKIPVKMILYDDKTDATASANFYERLATVDKVHFFLGGYSTTLIFANTVVAEKHGIPYVNGGGAATEIYKRGYKWIFCTIASIEKLAFTTMDFIDYWQDQGKLPKPAKIAIAWENTAHGKDYTSGVNQRAKANPQRYQVVLDESFEYPGAKDHRPLLNKLKAASADIFLSDTHLEDYVLMQRQYAEMGLYHQLVSYGARGPEKSARDALGPAANYIVAASWWRPDLPYPQVKTFVDAYTKKYNKSPDWYQAAAYEAARTLFKAIETAGTLDRAKVRDALANMDWKESILVGQQVKFQANGQIDNPFVVTQNLPDGTAPIVWPLDAATGKAVVPIPK